ncbi:MAG: zinc ribbon domain-containing protein, partial [Myxococcota bacterium]|nr:zinc ribbon domain-containing protein [Myxococcota bacterium]
TRLALRALGGGPAKEGGPEKAVAWNDEDAITMAVAAGTHCLRGTDRQEVDALILASTSHSFKEKQGAAVIARALSLRRDVQTTDLGSSTRSGLSALRAALDAVGAGSASRVLVIASDCRMAAPGTPMEAHLGDGAAALLIAKEDVMAEFEEGYAISDEIVDVWRSESDAFSHSWEDRFVIQEGYQPRLTEAVEGLFQKMALQATDFTKFALYAPDKRSHAGVCRSLGLDPAQIQDPLFGQLGNAGAAFASLQLISALERAKADDRIGVASYGDGAEALSFRVNEKISQAGPRRGVAWHLDRRRPIRSYDQYLKARNLSTSEWPTAAGPGLSATIHFRDRSDDIAFCGQQCNACGGVQFPAQRVCERCFSRDDFHAIPLADKIGHVLTYTMDYFFPTPNPPTLVAVCEIEGARAYLQIVDCEPEGISIGLPVEFTFRRIHEAGGRPNYYWKARPVPGEDVPTESKS